MSLRFDFSVVLVLKMVYRVQVDIIHHKTALISQFVTIFVQTHPLRFNAPKLSDAGDHIAL